MMSNLQEVATDDLLSFQDFPSVHSAGNTIVSSVPVDQIDVHGNLKPVPNRSNINMQGTGDNPIINSSSRVDDTDPAPPKSFWTLEYYQKFFDVDTKDVVDRMLASVTPKWDNSLKHHLHAKPDLYGPFWISVTLIFTIAISGNVANYLQHASTKYHWKYDFHLVSYAATTICLYVTVIPLVLWGLIKYTSQTVNDVEGFEESRITPGILELICIYGYSLFVYIPASILWSVPINMLQWLLVLIAAFVSGSVLIFTLLPVLRLSKYKFLLMLGIIGCHLLLATGFVLYFFHVPNSVPVMSVSETITASHIEADIKNNTIKH